MTTSNVKTLCEELMLTTSADENLLKTLSKIFLILKSNEKFQKEIFINLSDKGLSKLMMLMKSELIDVRKLSVKLLVEMIYNNEVLQNIFCEKFNFNPIGNIICLNWFPKVLKENLTLDANIINEIKSAKCSGKNKFWMWPNNSKYNDEAFPDPQKYLIGFYYSNKAAYVIPSQETSVSESSRSLILKLEREEEKEDTSKGSFSKNKIEQAAGSGSESSTKIRDKKSESENFEKLLKTEPIFNEDIKKTETNQVNLNVNKVNANKVTKIANYTNQGSLNTSNKTQQQRNISPFANQIMFNVKTKIDKKGFLNSSDIPVIKNETAYKNEKAVSSNTKTKHHYSRSIDTKEHPETHNIIPTSTTVKTTNKSPLPTHTFKK